MAAIYNPMDLDRKHILITGASSGIGQATCVLASKLGAVVSLVARNEERLKETLSVMNGEGHRAYTCDLVNVDGVQDLVKKIVSEQGAVDGMVHCAGIAANRPLKLSVPEFVTEMMNIHYFAFVELMRAVSKKRNCNDGASFVGISSVAGIQGDKAQGAYAAAKGAVQSVIHSFAKELSIRQMRVNSVAFGMIATGMYQTYIDGGGDPQELLGSQYMGVGEMQDAANIICFLLSDASKFITGTNLLADGGMLS